MPCIVVVGLSRSGKDTIANYIVQRYDFRKYDLNEVIIGELKRRRTSATKTNIEAVGNELRKKEGAASIVRTVLRTAPRGERIVVVGIKSLPEMKELRLTFPDSIVVRVDSDEEKRYTRKDRSDSVSREDFFARDDYDISENSLDRVLDSVDYVIDNNQGIAPLYGKIEDFIKKYEL